MSKPKIKKYVIRLEENNFLAKLAYYQDSESIVEKTGFAKHEEAMDWLVEELEKFYPNYHKMSFFKLASMLEENPNHRKIKEALDDKISELREEMFFTFVQKESMDENKAAQLVNKMCGKKWTESFKKAKDNTLDALFSLEEEKRQKRLHAMISYAKNASWVASEEAKVVLELIRKIKGSKIITVNVNNNVEVFDIQSDGTVGYAKEHENLFLKQIDSAFKQSNSFIIRQFIENSEEEVIVKNNKKIKIPWKALYSFILHGKKIIPMSAEAVEDAMTHDQNGNKIPPEDKVIYKDFSEVLV